MLSRQSVIQILEWPQNRVMSVHFGGTFVTGHRLCSIKAGYFILMFVYRSTITWDVYVRNNCGKNEYHKILRCEVSFNCTKINNGELTFGVELTQPLWQMWRLIYLFSRKQRTHHMFAGCFTSILVQNSRGPCVREMLLLSCLLASSYYTLLRSANKAIL